MAHSALNTDREMRREIEHAERSPDSVYAESMTPSTPRRWSAPGSAIRPAFDGRAQTVQRLQAMLGTQIVDILHQSLADCTILQFQCRQARWNMMFRDMSILPGLFREIAGAMAGHAEGLAERIIVLGGRAHCTLAIASERSGLDEHSGLSENSHTDIDRVFCALAVLSDTLAADVALLVEAGDTGSADRVAAIGRSAEHYMGCLGFYRSMTPGNGRCPS